MKIINLSSSKKKYLIMMSMIILSLAAAVLVLVVEGYSMPSSDANSRNNGYIPELNREVMAGIWKLTHRKSFLPLVHDYPMKEFTVYPKKKKKKDKFPSPLATPATPSATTTSAMTTTALPYMIDKDLLIKLKQDGSFIASQLDDIQEYKDEGLDDEEEELDSDVDWTNSKSQTSSSSDLHSTPTSSTASNIMMKGTWDYLDGKLILATDRPSASNPTTTTSTYNGNNNKANDNTSSSYYSFFNKQQDTIFTGRVIAKKEPCINNNNDKNTFTSDLDETKDEREVGDVDAMPVEPQVNDSTAATTPNKSQSIHDDNNNKSPNSKTSSTPFYDIYLSVPNGSINTGKFTYPKHHPFFFDLPIFHPTCTGFFELHQILGRLNTLSNDIDRSSNVADSSPAPSSQKNIKKNNYYNNNFYNKYNNDNACIKCQDLAGKRYILTSYPITFRKNKDKKTRTRRAAAATVNKGMEDDLKFGIRAMEIELYANNTFATISGLGSSVVLRGKWDIFSSSNNNNNVPYQQLWMQIWRFGFGRSVSGSTYSEGKCLTKEDEKTYWGKIRRLDVIRESRGGITEANTTTTTTSDDEDKANNNNNDHLELEQPQQLLPGQSMTGDKVIEIQGTVLLGTGLDPCPVAKFTMIEKTSVDDEDCLEEEDDDDNNEEEDEHDDNDMELGESIFE